MPPEGPGQQRGAAPGGLHHAGAAGRGGRSGTGAYLLTYLSCVSGYLCGRIGLGRYTYAVCVWGGGGSRFVVSRSACLELGVALFQVSIWCLLERTIWLCYGRVWLWDERASMSPVGFQERVSFGLAGGRSSGFARNTFSR